MAEVETQTACLILRRPRPASRQNSSQSLRWLSEWVGMHCNRDHRPQAGIDTDFADQFCSAFSWFSLLFGFLSFYLIRGPPATPFKVISSDVLRVRGRSRRGDCVVRFSCGVAAFSGHASRWDNVSLTR